MKKDCAVTIGFFDGVHRGHRYLLQQLEERAREHECGPVAVTFSEHPRRVVREHEVPRLLNTLDERLALLRQSFSGETVVLPFTAGMGRTTAREFMQAVLRDMLGARMLLMGYNHRFGHGGGTMEEYVQWGRETGIEVLFADALGGAQVSSSRIRSCIGRGEIDEANAMLGYRYFFSGTVAWGKQIGRTIGFPTANVVPPAQKQLPALGVYAVCVTLPDGTRRGGMLSIGRRPTVDADGDVSVEVHVFDFGGDLYGKRISVELAGRLRDERHFPSLEALRLQLVQDMALAKTLMEGMA